MRSLRVIVVQDGVVYPDNRLSYYEKLMTELYNEARRLEGNVDGEPMDDVDFEELRYAAENAVSRTRKEEDAALRTIAAWTLVQLVRRKQEDDYRR